MVSLLRSGNATARTYSYRSASTGSRRDARMAGIRPLTNPTSARIVVAINTVPGEMMSRMSPTSPC
jgi:hypothetical protein